MPLTRLEIHHFRNLAQMALHPLGKINLIHGDNGSGKSSILEAIHVLGFGRSFRTQKYKSLIQTHQDQFTLFASTQSKISEDSPAISPTTALGMSRSLDGKRQLRLSGEKAENQSQLAEHLPIQILDANTYSLLTGTPEFRRQFLDWGVFHVEHHRFMEVWRRFRHALKHRNKLLKSSHLDMSLVRSWTQQFCLEADKIHSLRERYVDQYIEVLTKTLPRILPLENFSIEYYPGWDVSQDLETLLELHIDSDKKMGFTQRGPQRADLRIKTNGLNVVEVLSRGQQKLLVYGMKIAQGMVLSDIDHAPCIYLLDDFSAELDEKNRSLVMALLSELDCQVFITDVDTSLMDIWSEQTIKPQMFHVEHGKLLNLDK